MKLIENLKWRYATKNFDSSRKISNNDLEQIKEAVRLSASAYGLQPYKVLIIEDQSLRNKLKPVSWNQRQITDASHLVVFCNYTSVKTKHIDEFIELTAQIQNRSQNELTGYRDFLKVKMEEKSDVEQLYWTAKQAYLAMGTLLAACAELKIDACPMEGFEAEKYNEILGLTEQGLHASVIAALGYRSKDDANQHQPKIRKSVDNLFEYLGDFELVEVMAGEPERG
ncbi:NAD(P)H-dependent oxidoreductase [Prolixibacter bellariivorans]|uniref:NAD(P)H-dependent oxidoreductase n=2 Tax=Prolixibacter bellariivorans TaxID=314319 RepID=A0A5M4ATZ5_9BACT|nr:NAD(P)H-dependent oxidoreductase [Prolixibacter bellariivorans]GET31419.1 NAD(P)H-dependent oxidoreductase [Prolixibacter bellariivorans]